MGTALSRRNARPTLLDDVVGRLYQSKGRDIAEVVAPLPPDQRAKLAVFCYGKAHLRNIGTAIAAMCDDAALMAAAPADEAGWALFQLSRERSAPSAPVTPRHKITLASFA